MALETHPLISVGELASLQTNPGLLVLDVRWALGQSDGRERYLEGHIPEARYIDLDESLAAVPSPERGRHPLPSAEDFQRTLRSFGVSTDSLIVAYDQAQSLSAARLWWMLRNSGLHNARVLDGGLQAWIAAGQELSVGNSRVALPGDVTISWGSLPTIDTDGAAGFAERGILLDARAGERYRGEVEPMDARAGHIPGAVSAPTSENLDESGAFLPAAELRSRFAGLGVTDGRIAASYCGSGITAAHQLLALEIAGYSAALYPGSWSQWASDPARPAAKGATP